MSVQTESVQIAMSIFDDPISLSLLTHHRTGETCVVLEAASVDKMLSVDETLKLIDGLYKYVQDAIAEDKT